MEQPYTDFFAASNSATGFQNYFPEIFNPEHFDKIYIIKGGPGSGKSTFMKKAAARAREKGCLVERYFCSSDPESLDGVAIYPQRTAIIDCTMPHMCDPKFPGAVEEIINTGTFFDCEALKSKREQIRTLHLEKSRIYQSVYNYLGAALKLKETVGATVAPMIYKEKLKKAAARSFATLKADTGEIKIRFVGAISTNGPVHLNTLYKQAKCKICICDKYGTADVFLSELLALSKKSGKKAIVCPDPLSDSYFEEIMIGETLFYKSNTKDQMADHIINMERFIDKELQKSKKHTLKYLGKCFDGLLDGAYDSLRKIK